MSKVVVQHFMRFIGAIAISGLIMLAFIYYGPCGIKRAIEIEQLIKLLPGVYKSFFMVSLPIVLFSFLFSCLLVALGRKIKLVDTVFLTPLSCFPVFVVGVFLILKIGVPPTGWLSYIMAGMVLGICDAFFIELYRHAEIEINTVKGESYVLLARVNGITGWNLFWYIKNDFIIHFAKIFISKLILLISSAVIIEWILDIKGGIGSLIIMASAGKDIESLIATESVIVAFVIFFRFANSLIDQGLDPRLREE